ncbi:MAG: hypothetical protein P4L67_05060 [Candidatus Pacebacteria bacterium]|nr:hypothetical protein [Candidatus Paceibacterota bacterium]
MKYREARAYADRIKEDPFGRPDDVAEFRRRKGWVALLYPSWPSCSKAEFGGVGLKQKPARDQCDPNPISVKKKQEKPKPIQEWVRIITGMADANGGMLLSHKRLEKLGLYNIRHVMARSPEAFKHIKQETRNTLGVVIGYRMGGKFYPLEADSNAA